MIVHGCNANNKNRSKSLNESSSINMNKLKYNIYPQPIGAGSFATVYRGVDKKGNDVAIKKIRITSVSSKMLDKFLFELHVGTILKNKNIVECIDTFKTERHWYIVSEFCDVGTFLDIITLVKKYDDVNEKEYIAKIYLNQLKDAIQYLRSLDIIHRDLKPQNILLKSEIVDGKQVVVVKLADFGFARYFNKHTQQDNGNDDMVNTICGSPIYMAPEMLINGKYNMKADLWSFGVIMYETLFGFCPYNYPKNINQLCERIKNQKINYPIKYSNECIDLIKSLLTIDPENRMTWDNFFSHEWFVNKTHDRYVNNEYNKHVDDEYGKYVNNEHNTDLYGNQDCLFDMEPENNVLKEPIIADTLSKVVDNEIINLNKNSNNVIHASTHDYEILKSQQYKINKPKQLQKFNDFIMIDHDDIDIDEVDKQYQSQISFTGSVINIIGSSINILKSFPRSI